MAANRINDTLAVRIIADETTKHTSVTNRVDWELNLFSITAQLLTIDVFLSLVPLDQNRLMSPQSVGKPTQNWDLDKIAVKKYKILLKSFWCHIL